MTRNTTTENTVAQLTNDIDRTHYSNVHETLQQDRAERLLSIKAGAPPEYQHGSGDSRSVFEIYYYRGTEGYSCYVYRFDNPQDTHYEYRKECLTSGVVAVPADYLADDAYFAHDAKAVPVEECTEIEHRGTQVAEQIVQRVEEYIRA